jgi:hypothetical protein
MSNKELKVLDGISCLANHLHNNFNSEGRFFNFGEASVVEGDFATFLNVTNTDLERLNIEFKEWDGAITFSDTAIKCDKNIIEVVEAALDFGLTLIDKDSKNRR